MTVATSRSIDNLNDTTRRVPLASTGLQMLAVQGPTNGGARILPAGINSIMLAQAYVTASGAAGGVPSPRPGTHWTSRKLADGTTELTEAAAVDRSAETWYLWVDRGTTGGQTTVAP